MERYWVANGILASNECGGLVKYDDAQRALDAERRERRAVEQIAGQALGYPWFKDDQKNFPGATEADGVCIGEHVAGTIVQELASKLATLQAQADHTRIERNRLWGELADLQAQLADRDAMILQMGKQAARLAKDGLAAKAQLRKPILVCQRCGRVSQDGWVPSRYECDELNGSLQCPDCQCIDLEINTAKELATLCTQAQAQLRQVEGERDGLEQNCLDNHAATEQAE